MKTNTPARSKTARRQRSATYAPLPQLNPPLAGRLTPLFHTDADMEYMLRDGHVLLLIARLPGVDIFKDANGYIVDLEVAADIDIKGSGNYSVRHQRLRADRQGALRYLLAAIVPAEFSDLLPKNGKLRIP